MYNNSLTIKLKKNVLTSYIIGRFGRPMGGASRVYYLPSLPLLGAPGGHNAPPASKTRQKQRLANRAAQAMHTNHNSAQASAHGESANGNLRFLGKLTFQKASLKKLFGKLLVGLVAIIFYPMITHQDLHAAQPNQTDELQNDPNETEDTQIQLLVDDAKEEEPDNVNKKKKNRKKFRHIATGDLQIYLNGEGKNTTFALVDVEGTLIVKEKINLGLIKALKNAKIRDIALFTKMGPSKMGNERAKQPERITRQELIKTLEDNGITVWAVITNADPIYKCGLGAAYKDFVAGTLSKKLNQQQDKNKKPDLIASSGPNLLNDNNNQQIKPVDHKGNGDKWEEQQLAKEKAIYDGLLSNNTGKEQNKKSMINYFMHLCPKFAGRLFLIDDDVALQTLELEGNTQPATKIVLTQPIAKPKNGNSPHKQRWYGWSLEVKRDAIMNELRLNCNSILYTAADEYHKRGTQAKFTLVCIQVPDNWTTTFNNICDYQLYNHKSSARWKPYCTNKEVVKNISNAIGPHTQAYYEAVLSTSLKVSSKKQPLIYTRPVGPVTMYYLKNKLSPYNWGVWSFGKCYPDKQTKSILFITLIEKPSKK